MRKVYEEREFTIDRLCISNISEGLVGRPVNPQPSIREIDGCRCLNRLVRTIAEVCAILVLSNQVKFAFALTT